MRVPGSALASSLLALVLGCSSSSSNSATPPASTGADGGSDAGDDASWDRPVTRPADTTADTNRQACMYGRGALPAETLGTSTPVDSAIPIENVVVVMMENHSFDNYFGHLNAYAKRTDIESAPDTASNVDLSGTAQPYTHALHECTLDTDHGWSATHLAINGGAMDGFAKINDGYDKSALPATSTDPSLWSGGRSLWWYDQRDLPFYYALASTFAIADHYHASVPGPTWPNRDYLYGATSFGTTYNLVFPDLTAYPYPGNDATVLDELEKRKVTWNVFSDSTLSTLNILYGSAVNNQAFDGTQRWGRKVTGSIADFTAAAQAGTLPQVSFVDPNLLSEFSNGNGLDEHPPGDIQSGQKFASDIIHAVFASPQWAHVALFLVYDEHGGFYDHVAPPRACAPDSTPPKLGLGDTTKGGFDLYGVRVPFVVVSPYARRAYVGHHLYDHTSITRFIEAKFKMPALTARDANAEPPMDLFDFTTPTFATPPNLDAPTIDATELSYCQTTFGG